MLSRLRHSAKGPLSCHVNDLPLSRAINFNEFVRPAGTAEVCSIVQTFDIVCCILISFTSTNGKFVKAERSLSEVISKGAQDEARLFTRTKRIFVCRSPPCIFSFSSISPSGLVCRCFDLLTIHPADIESRADLKTCKALVSV